LNGTFCLKSRREAAILLSNRRSRFENAEVAQLAEQVIRNDQVVGSNPTFGYLPPEPILTLDIKRQAAGRILKI
jgi:hypothetical protein